MRDILVHVTRYDAWSGSVQYAAQLAAYLRASLTGLYCVSGTSAAWTGGIVGATLPAVTPLADEDRLHAALAAKNAFCNYASSLGVRHCNWVVHRGDPTPALIHLGHWHDLLVLGRGDASPWESDRALADIVMSSHLPCMVVPGRPGLTPLQPQRIAVAWDGSLHAVRALHAAVPLLEQARKVVLLTGGRSGDVHRETGLPEFDLGRYCESHGLEIERMPLEPPEDQDGIVVRLASVRAKADLLVMGAFGHSRLRERVFGGVTQYLLQHSSIPLLLRH